MTPPDLRAATAALLPGKIQTRHLLRQAVVYIRQSSLQQVADCQESTARQYALQDRARAFGWSIERITVIDEDQGRSGQSAEGRLGFQRLLAEVALDHVGIIFSLEMSRLARSCKDWHQLLELCGVFGTLLADTDGVYDPTQYNDRLLLGLKGAMSEAELHVLRGRLNEGRLNKARRGELFNHAPIGYVRSANGDLELDSDEQVQAVVRLVFAQFVRQRSLHGLLRYLVKHQVRIPVRPHSGPDRGQLEWRRPNRETLQNLLHHPVYAGYYRWGHRQIDPRKQVSGRPGTGRTNRAPADCLVLLEGRCPAYISVAQFEANQQQLEANRARGTAPGTPRNGPALLSGLVVCGRCGHRLCVSYTEGGKGLRYQCSRAMSNYAEPLCQSLAGRGLDALVAEQLLAALAPAAVELSLAAIADVEQERLGLHRHWSQQLERAHYEVERAARQYHTVEPENRLVARELERRWEAALGEEQRLQAEYARFCRSQPRQLSEQDQAHVRQLSQDIPGLWQAETTTSSDRQEIARLLLQRVEVRVQEQSEQVSVRLVWQGGHTSEHELVRPVARYDQRSDYQHLLRRINELRAAGQTLAAVAEQLNAEGYRPPKRTPRFTGAMVGRLLWQRGTNGSRRSPSAVGLLQEHEWFLGDLAKELGMPRDTLHRWRKVGWVQARQLPLARPRWLIWADADELARLRQLRQHPRGWSEDDTLGELKKPRPRPKA